MRSCTHTKNNRRHVQKKKPTRAAGRPASFCWRIFPLAHTEIKNKIKKDKPVQPPDVLAHTCTPLSNSTWREEREGGRGRERERERETECMREREREREADKQTDRDREKERQRESARERERKRGG